MTLPLPLAERIDLAVDRHASTLRDLALRIHANPELKFEEFKASGWIDETLEGAGLAVERGVGGLPTALRSRSGSIGPSIAVLAEYDALPDVGHACGHNLIATAALGAYLAIAPFAAELGGTVALIGTPAEEGGGGKITLLDAGVFDGVDAALMVHPADRNVLVHPTLANLWVQFDFTGRPSHAAIAPWDGASALTACIQTFNLIDSQRVHFRDGVRVHGWIPRGGQAVNIIAERASCEFSVRATTSEELARVLEIVIRCARGAAMAAGVEIAVTQRRGYKEMLNNEPLATRFGQQLARTGRAPKLKDDLFGRGSTDMGDVSQALPSIHPWVAICSEGAALCHEHAFAGFAASPEGLDTMLAAARSMACTMAEYLSDPSLRADVRSAFEARS
jgi:amidohydrolase